MTRGIWSQPRSYRRPANTRPERKKYLIVTEGATEEVYFSHFKTRTGPQIVIKDGKDNKLSLVAAVVAERDARVAVGEFIIGQDEVWVVLDRDKDTSNRRDKANFNAALSLADREGILVAYSNDSFELWYLLHYREVSTALHRRVIDEKLSEHLGRTYMSRHRSGVEDLYEDCVSGQAEAIKRAHALIKKLAGETPENANPSTTVHLLVEKIINEEGFRQG